MLSCERLPTSVPTDERLKAPLIRSPSQWPGTSRASISSGRLIILSDSGTMALPAKVVRLRNVGRKPNAFWLELSGARFYPDFVAMLTDGRILVVEYKGAYLADGAVEKKLIGELWAEASGGKCLFAMPVGNGFAEIDRAIAASY